MIRHPCPTLLCRLRSLAAAEAAAQQLRQRLAAAEAQAAEALAAADAAVEAATEASAAPEADGAQAEAAAAAASLAEVHGGCVRV